MKTPLTHQNQLNFFPTQFQFQSIHVRHDDDNDKGTRELIRTPKGEGKEVETLLSYLLAATTTAIKATATKKARYFSIFVQSL